MNIKSFTAAAALCAVPLISNAGIIFEWRGLNNEVPHGISLQLEFDGKTVDSGAFNFQLDQERPAQARPDLGLIALRYSFPGVNGSMAYFPRDGGFSSGYGRLDMKLTFEKGGFLSGYILANDNQSHFRMNSQGRVFTILDANSDAGMPGAGCGWTTDVQCAGATGHIRRTDIPEPGTFALLGVGLLAALCFRSKAFRN